MIPPGAWPNWYDCNELSQFGISLIAIFILHKNILLLIFVLFSGTSLSQTLQTVPGEKNNGLRANIGILTDYSSGIEELSADTSLHFLALPDSISVGHIYWLKIVVDNPNELHRDYVVRITPQLKNTLYYFHPDHKKWITSQKDALNNTGARLLGRHSVSFAGKRSTTFFVKIDLTIFGHRDRKLRLAISFQPEAQAAQHEQTIRIAWVCCMVVLMLFMLNNLYVYLNFRDKTILFYLIAQLGGMFYITGYRWISYQFLPIRVFNIDVHEIITYYDLNKIIVHVAIVVTLYGLTMLTRTFLNTKKLLPRMDGMLRLNMGVYAGFTVILMGLNMAGYKLEYHTLPYDNVYCGIIILFILVTGIAAYRQKIPLATPFLIANGFPLLFMLAIPLSHLFISFQNEENLWIPELVVLTQTLALSFALVARTKAVQRDLSVAEIDKRQLEFNLKEAGYRVQLNQLEIAKMNAVIDSEKAKNELLQERLETNQRELASSTLHMVQKNELLSHLKSQMQLLSRPNPSTAQGMRQMSLLIDNSSQLDSDWKKFKIHFEQVHPYFFEELEARYPQLTMKETRLYAYLHMKLSHKEIAALLSIDPASVRRAKTRLYKKMAIPETL